MMVDQDISKITQTAFDSVYAHSNRYKNRKHN